METGTNRKNVSYTKIISIYLWICIAGLIISIPVFNEMINKHDLAISNDMCGLIAEKMNNSIKYITESVNGRAEILSGSVIEDWDVEYEGLTRNLELEGCNSIGLVDINGNVYGNASENAEFEKWGLKEAVSAVDDVYVSAPYRQGCSGEMVFTIFAPIYQAGTRAGELFMTFELEEIQDMAQSDILKDNMEIYLMNPFSNNYIRCFGADESQIGSWNNTRLLYDKILPVRGTTYSQWLSDMRNGKNGEVVFFKMDDVLYTQVYVNIDVMKDWSVVVRIPNDALSYNLRMFHMAVIVVIVVLIFSLFCLFILSYRSADAEQKKLRYLSTHDPLTKLTNRRAFQDIYQNYLETTNLDMQNGALVFFDIDYFKQVNDGFGHEMGDRVLKEFALIVQEVFDKFGIVSRFGGDEFVLLIRKIEDKKFVEYHLNELQRRLKQLNFLVDDKGNIFSIHFSAGVVEIKNDNNSLEEVEKKADQALYDVKQRGRDGYAWYLE